MPIARVAPDAQASSHVLFVEPNSQRHMKRLKTGAFQIVVKVLNALLVTDGRILVRRARPGFCWILSAIAVYLIQMLRLCVIRLQLVIADGPRGRDAAVMTNLTKVFLSQTKERCAVEFGVAANEVIRMRMQLLAVAVAPRLFGVVFTFEIYGARAPVLLFPRNVIAAFEEQGLLAGGREFVGECAATRARADDDYVVVIVTGHDALRSWGVTARSS